MSSPRPRPRRSKPISPAAPGAKPGWLGRSRCLPEWPAWLVPSSRQPTSGRHSPNPGQPGAPDPSDRPAPLGARRRRHDLVALSSGITAAVLRTREPAPVAQRGVSALEAQYAEVSQDLGGLLEKARATLTPETMATIERNLAIIDAALTETREALARDPGNQALGQMVVAAWRQKVDLLRRATALGTEQLMRALRLLPMLLLGRLPRRPAEDRPPHCDRRGRVDPDLELDRKHPDHRAGTGIRSR